MGKFLISISIFLLSSCVAYSNANMLSDLFYRLKNYKTDYSVEEIIRLFLKGTPLTVKYLFNKIDDTPIDEDVTFWCINNDTKTLQQVFLNDPDITKKFNFSKPVAFLTHGWIDNVNRTWIQDTVKDYIHFVDTNVIVVDWNRLASYEYTISATRNVFMVADYLTTFIRYLNQLGIAYDNVTLVGHSLGGQISGLVGGQLKGEIGQIFALDPAGPLFTMPFNNDISKRLDPSDAKYVQVIYTTRWMLGCGDDVGHQNFKPNVGIIPQSACIFPTVTGGMSPEMLSCSHSQATAYFRYSLNPDNIFTARQCKSALSYVSGLCFGSTYDRMGIYAKRTPGKFYLLTSSTAPFV